MESLKYIKKKNRWFEFEGEIQRDSSDKNVVNHGFNILDKKNNI